MAAVLDLPCPVPCVPLSVPLTLDPGARGSLDTPHSSTRVTEGVTDGVTEGTGTAREEAVATARLRPSSGL